MPITSDGVPITLCTVGFAILSFLVLIGTGHYSRGNSLFGPPHGRGVNWVTFAMGTFASAFLFCLGLNIDKAGIVFPYTLLHSTLQAIKTTGGGSTPVSLSTVKLSRLFCGDSGHTCYASVALCHAVYFYHCILCIVAPVSFVSLLVSRLMHFFALPRVCRRALRRDTYVFDELSDANLTLAQSIKNHAQEGERANLVFTGASNSASDVFSTRALELEATCVEHSVETVWRHLPKDKHIHIILSSKDEERNITRASAIRKACEVAAENWRPSLPCELPIVSRLPVMKKILQDWQTTPHVTINAVTSLRGAEALFEREELGTSLAGEGRLGHEEVGSSSASSEQCKRVPVRCIDWTRNTTEMILRKYPLFLLGRQPKVPASGDAEEIRNGYLNWQNAMLDNPARHVVIVGAGHVGMEFLALALSTSRNCSPSGEEPLQYRFDVFDSKADALHKTECLAKHRFIAQTGGDEKTLDSLSCHFHLYDVLGHDFMKKLTELDQDSDKITYVVVALGDDFVTAQVSLRIRELFAEAPADWPAGVKRTSPVIVAVLDDAELCDALAHATRKGFDYAIDAMGSPQDMYTYDLVFGDEQDEGKTPKVLSEHERRATRAKALHKKYKLFSYARSMQADTDGMRGLVVDWGAAYSKKKSKDDGSDTTKAIREFKKRQLAMEESGQGGAGDASDSWLRLMEQERRRVYSWAEGDGLQ